MKPSSGMMSRNAVQTDPRRLDVKPFNPMLWLLSGLSLLVAGVGLVGLLMADEDASLLSLFASSSLMASGLVGVFLSLAASAVINRLQLIFPPESDDGP